MRQLTLLNTGLPLIFGEWTMLLFGLIFIIAIEAFVYNKFRKNFKKSLKDISIANVVSTVVGIPLANVLRYLVMTLMTLIMPTTIFPNKDDYVWETLSPGKNYKLLLWEHFFIVAFIIVINFIVTVYVEFWALKKLNKQEERKILRRQSFIFNSYSYGVILILVIVYEIHQQVYLQ